MTYCDMCFNLLPAEWLPPLASFQWPSSLWWGPPDREKPFYRCDPVNLAWFFQAVMGERKKVTVTRSKETAYRFMAKKFAVVLEDALCGFTEAELTEYEALCAESDAGKSLPAPMKPEPLAVSLAFR